MILTRLCKSGCLTGQCAPQSGSEPAASLGWVNRDVRPLAAPLRPSPASQQRRRARLDGEKYGFISAKRYDPLMLLNWYDVRYSMTHRHNDRRVRGRGLS
eukprot:scaffold18541_cov67-Phaeocystis_antarctica.AAC.1